MQLVVIGGKRIIARRPYVYREIPIVFDPLFFKTFLYKNCQNTFEIYQNMILGKQFQEKDVKMRYNLVQNIMDNIIDILVNIIEIECKYQNYIKCYNFDITIKNFGFEKIYHLFQQWFCSLWNVEILDCDCKHNDAQSYDDCNSTGQCSKTEE